MGKVLIKGCVICGGKLKDGRHKSCLRCKPIAKANAKANAKAYALQYYAKHNKPTNPEKKCFECSTDVPTTEHQYCKDCMDSRRNKQSLASFHKAKVTCPNNGCNNKMLAQSKQCMECVSSGKPDPRKPRKLKKPIDYSRSIRVRPPKITSFCWDDRFKLHKYKKILMLCGLDNIYLSPLVNLIKSGRIKLPTSNADVHRFKIDLKNLILN